MAQSPKEEKFDLRMITAAAERSTSIAGIDTASK